MRMLAQHSGAHDTFQVPPHRRQSLSLNSAGSPHGFSPGGGGG